MDRLFDEFTKPARRRMIWPKPEGPVIPCVDLYDKKSEIGVKIELPGVRREDIALTITKDAIILKGEIKREDEVQEEDYYISERMFGNFSRTIALPFEVESEKAQATMKNGVLEIVAPKKEVAKPKEIKIEVK
ncbi:MAG TPA: Hsp20/alpha crystallin family protein [Dissulfurispiraceae bacterium]|nr:Hsp20/alpha crystallin family protein [Dissulfurispiraceae bacterium]